MTPLNDPSTRSIVALPKQIPHDWRVFSVENGTNDLRDGKVPGYKITFSGGETGNMIRLCIHTPGNEDFCSVSGQVYKHASHEDCVSGKLTGKECSGYTESRVIDVEHPTPDATVMISYKTPPAEAINLFENQPLLFHWERFEWVNRDAFIAR
ncbi:hypothetical protein [Timonella sp. A28]|uniref:hypothetical protein n=1 Tax=Timonella sp. A28 TaxID=3442640 RepID=UPI003EB7882F